MKKKKICILVALVCALPSFAQDDRNSTRGGAYPKNNMSTKMYLAYPDIREADVMWTKRIWRVIDLREKINLPFAYPKTDIRDRKSLMDVLWNAAKEGSITLYANDEFTQMRPFKEAESLGGAGVFPITIIGADPPYNPIDTFIKREFETEKVIQYRVMEDWFFDKQRSVMDVRIIGIAPIVYATDDQGNVREGGETKPLFWVYFPDARWLLAQAPAFNMMSGATSWSYDDIFQKRYFNSYIMKESNVYDRRISEYAQGIKALEESDRIKEMIINFEHDMWEY